jgi:hypothetical protein
LTLARLATRVADQPRATTDEDDGTMTSPLHAPQGQEWKQASDVQAIRRRIKPDIRRARSPQEVLAKLVGPGAVGDQASPREILPKLNGRTVALHACIIATYGAAPTRESSG